MPRAEDDAQVRRIPGEEHLYNIVTHCQFQASLLSQSVRLGGSTVAEGEVAWGDGVRSEVAGGDCAS